MHRLYDTDTVRPLDRYDYYQAAVNTELAPMSVHGRVPGRLLAVMSIVKIGDFEIEALTWSADSEVVARRTGRHIRASDPEFYRLILGISARLRLEQAGNQVALGARDIALYDLSRPVQSMQLPTRGPVRLAMLTFPRNLVPIADATVRPLIGTAIPRRLRGCGLITQFLIELSEAVDLAHDPGLADVLHECTVGLIRQRLGLPNGMTPDTLRLLQLARVRDIIRRNLKDPDLDPARIAILANMSPRSLHQLFHGADTTPMQLLKLLRLEECRRSLRDPALAATSIKKVFAKHGYVRGDQFARDFKQLFGISATQARGLTEVRVP